MAILFSENRYRNRIDSVPGLRDTVEARMKESSYTFDRVLSDIAVESPDIRSQLFSIPFPETQPMGIGFASTPPDLSYTLLRGPENLRTINDYWQRHRKQARRKPRVLDFGCGSGRLLRYACEFGEGIKVSGCEVNPVAVEWLRKALPCEVYQITERHDLSFLPRPMDLIYAWSIFTHFSEAEHLEWLRALMAALVPGGLLIATFKPIAQVDRMARDPEFRRTQSGAANVSLDDLQRQAASGFAFFELLDRKASAQHGIDAATFGQTFVSHDYVCENWSQFGTVEEIGPAWRDWQDLAVIRK